MPLTPSKIVSQNHAQDHWETPMKSTYGQSYRSVMLDNVVVESTSPPVSNFVPLSSRHILNLENVTDVDYLTTLPPNLNNPESKHYSSRQSSIGPVQVIDLTRHKTSFIPSNPKPSNVRHFSDEPIQVIDLTLSDHEDSNPRMRPVPTGPGRRTRDSGNDFSAEIVDITAEKFIERAIANQGLPRKGLKHNVANKSSSVCTSSPVHIIHYDQATSSMGDQGSRNRVVKPKHVDNIKNDDHSCESSLIC